MKQLALNVCKKVSGGIVVPPDKPVVLSKKSNG